jgi:UDP-glucuronate 4-epimerase
MKILVTGTAGFIGFHLAKQLLNQGHKVVGLDCINDYYDVNLKYARLLETGIKKESIAYNKIIQSALFENYTFVQLKLEDRANMAQFFAQNQFDAVCHLAAQAGVRYSLENPHAYIESNLVGFLNILEGCRNSDIKNLSYASSSSVYGANAKLPFSTDDNVDHPVSLYAATKKSNELMAHTYSHLYGIATTGLRFFTVYGPWGRPDMAPHLFTTAISNQKPIKLFNYGDMKRDFTYIDDIVDGVVRVIENPPVEPNPLYKIYNIGNSQPVSLMDFIAEIEKNVGIEAIKELLPMQPGDVPATWADVSDLTNNLGYRPKTPLNVGIKHFVEWYKGFYN